MRGYLTPGGEYYETFDGPAHPNDISVPLRPSDTYDFDAATKTWRTSRGTFTHSYPRIEMHEPESFSVAITERKLFTIRDVIYILSIACAALGVYFGVTHKLESLNSQVTFVQNELKVHQESAQIDIKECKTKIHELEVEQARNGK